MCNGECFEHTTRCRECEHLIVARVNKDYSKGSGICYHRNWEGGSYQYFSDEACENFQPRTSDTNVLSGGTIEEKVVATETHEFALVKGSESEIKYYELIGLQNGYFAPDKKKNGKSYIAPFYMYGTYSEEYLESEKRMARLYPARNSWVTHVRKCIDTYNMIRLHTSVKYPTKSGHIYKIYVGNGKLIQRD